MGFGGSRQTHPSSRNVTPVSDPPRLAAGRAFTYRTPTSDVFCRCPGTTTRASLAPQLSSCRRESAPAFTQTARRIDTDNRLKPPADFPKHLTSCRVPSSSLLGRCWLLRSKNSAPNFAHPFAHTQLEEPVVAPRALRFAIRAGQPKLTHHPTKIRLADVCNLHFKDEHSNHAPTLFRFDGESLRPSGTTLLHGKSSASG